MPQLPARPDLDQLRRQARELHRAAQDGDAHALATIRQVSEKVTLSAAQLAIARNYGFPSWPKLRAAVAGRHAGSGPAGPAESSQPGPAESSQPGPAESSQPGPADGSQPVSAGSSQAGHGPAAPPPQTPGEDPPQKSWEEMRKWAAELLLSRTGEGVDAWNRRAAAADPGDEQALRAWLAGQGVTGYAQALLVWERFGYPDFLTASADELIAGQYADRPHLRPVLDAVLAVLPSLGPATVQARKTLVSLVTPRRTFAVVQATAKSRVDLGLRLDSTQPGGRLLPVRDLGAATVRIALATPGDIDEEVLGWLRRAYEENSAPPAPRRPARRPAPVLGQLTVVVEGFDLPGLTCQPEPGGAEHRNIHVAISGRTTDRPSLAVPGRPGRAIEPVPGNADSARWEVPVTLRRDEDGFDFGGPFVGGDRTDRNLGLAWGDVPGDGTLRLFRGAKLRLVDVDPRLIEEAFRPGYRLTARVRLTDARGNPVCARVHPPAITWSAEPG